MAPFLSLDEESKDLEKFDNGIDRELFRMGK